MTVLLISGLLAAGIRLAMSIAIAALGEVVGQRSGVLNVGIEGIMLLGSFLAAFGAVKSGSPWGGLALAALGGLLLGALHGWFAIVQRADQIVSGIAIVILGLGLSSFLFRLTMGTAPSALPAFRAIDFGAIVDRTADRPCAVRTEFAGLPDHRRRTHALVRAVANAIGLGHPGMWREPGSRRSRRNQRQHSAFRVRVVQRRDGWNRRSVSRDRPDQQLRRKHGRGARVHRHRVRGVRSVASARHPGRRARLRYHRGRTDQAADLVPPGALPVFRHLAVLARHCRTRVYGAERSPATRTWTCV